MRQLHTNPRKYSEPFQLLITAIDLNNGIDEGKILTSFNMYGSIRTKESFNNDGNNVMLKPIVSIRIIKPTFNIKIGDLVRYRNSYYSITGTNYDLYSYGECELLCEILDNQDNITWEEQFMVKDLEIKVDKLKKEFQELIDELDLNGYVDLKTDQADITGAKTFNAITYFNNKIDLNNNTISNLKEPTSADEAATKNYVDNALTNIDLSNIPELDTDNTFTGKNTFKNEVIIEKMGTTDNSAINIGAVKLMVNPINDSISEIEASIQKIEKELGNIQGAVDYTEIEKMYNYIQKQLNTLKQDLGNVDTSILTRITNLETTLQTTKNEVDVALKKVETELKKLDVLNTYDAKFKQYDSTIQELEKDVNDSITANNTNIQSLETKLDKKITNNSAEISTLKQNETTTTQKIADNLTKINKNIADIQASNQKIADVENTLNTLNITQISQDITALKQKDTDLKSDIDANTAAIAKLDLQPITDKLNELEPKIEQNTTDISTNTQEIEKIKQLDLETKINTNKNNIAENLKKIEKNTSDIAAIDLTPINNKLQDLEPKITKNITDIAENLKKINNHKTLIDANTQAIAAIDLSGITSNTQEIEKLKQKDIDLKSEIDTNTQSITQLQTNTTTELNKKLNITDFNTEKQTILTSIDTKINPVKTQSDTNKNNIDSLNTKTDNTNSLLNDVINGLKTLKPFKYLGNWTQQPYKINDLVSKDNKLYLSTKDNNTDTPPSANWVLINEPIQVDLSNYYTKTEIDNSQNQQDTKIQDNKTALTTKLDTATYTQDKTQLESSINSKAADNAVVKLSGNQSVGGTKTFTDEIFFHNKIEFSGNRDNNSWCVRLNLDGINGANKVVDLIRDHRGGAKHRIYWNINAPEWWNLTGNYEWNTSSVVQFKGDVKAYKTPTTNEDVANKQYVDNKVSTIDLSTKLDTSTYNTDKQALETSINNKLDTTTFNTEIATKANDNQVVKLTGNQTINGEKTFNNKASFRQNDMSISLQPTGNNACFIGVHNQAGNRCMTIGKASSTSDKVTIQSDREDLDIICPNNKSVGILNTLRLGTNIKLGYGGNLIRIQPDTGYKELIFESLYLGFFGERTNGSKIFNLNFDSVTGNKELYLLNIHKAGSKFSIRYHTNNPQWVDIHGNVDFKSGGNTNFSGVVNVYKAPTENQHAVNKKYVDDIKTALKNEIKAKFASANDFNALKAAIANW